VATESFGSDFFRWGTLMHTYDQKLLVAWGNPQKSRFPSSSLPSFYFSDFSIKNDSDFDSFFNELHFPKMILTHFKKKKKRSEYFLIGTR